MSGAYHPQPRFPANEPLNSRRILASTAWLRPVSRTMSSNDCVAFTPIDRLRLSSTTPHCSHSPPRAFSLPRVCSKYLPIRPDTPPYWRLIQENLKVSRKDLAGAVHLLAFRHMLPSDFRDARLQSPALLASHLINNFLSRTTAQALQRKIRKAL
jgi:hypothetical protein